MKIGILLVSERDGTLNEGLRVVMTSATPIGDQHRHQHRHQHPVRNKLITLNF